jgi:hypothetical protein
MRPPGTPRPPLCELSPNKRSRITAYDKVVRLINELCELDRTISRKEAGIQVAAATEQKWIKKAGAPFSGAFMLKQPYREGSSK